MTELLLLPVRDFVDQNRKGISQFQNASFNPRTAMLKTPTGHTILAAQEGPT
jgi:hypothetical protein